MRYGRGWGDISWLKIYGIHHLNIYILLTYTNNSWQENISKSGCKYLLNKNKMHSCKPKPCTKNDLSLQQNHKEPRDALQSDTNNCTNIVLMYGTAFQLIFFFKSKCIY